MSIYLVIYLVGVAGRQIEGPTNQPLVNLSLGRPNCLFVFDFRTTHSQNYETTSKQDGHTHPLLINIKSQVNLALLNKQPFSTLVLENSMEIFKWYTIYSKRVQFYQRVVFYLAIFTLFIILFEL